MDLLTDIIQHAGLQRRLLDLRTFGGPTALAFPCERSMGLHVVAAGRVWLLDVPDGPIELGTGDIAVMARGCVHRVAAVPEPTSTVPAHLGDDGDSLPGGTEVALISGAYQFWHTPLHPLFQQLPPWFVLRAAQRATLEPLALALGLMQQELRHRQLGVDSVVRGLLDVVFTLLLREMVERLALEGHGWSQAVRDPQVRRALALMHADSAHPWTLEMLAERVGLARTTLAERFRVAMGDTPLNHLRLLRMQKAMQLLAEPGRTLEEVALEVGYQDAFGFSKVFKRVVGQSPRDFRRQDAQDRANPWRVGAGAG